MDFNYLYQRHQISLFMADNAASEAARRTHRALAEGYAGRIADALRDRSPLVGAA